MNVIDSASCVNVYLLRFDAEAEMQLSSGEALLEQFNSTFGNYEQFDTTCIFLMFKLSNADIMSIGITHPCQSDVELLARVEVETGLQMPRELILQFMLMSNDSTCSDSDYRDSTIVKFINNAKNNKKMDSKSEAIGKNNTVFVLSEYPCLSSVARDPFAKSNSKVFRYNDKYYAMSNNCEFNLGKAPMSAAFLKEHGKNIGTVRVLQEVLK